MQSFKENESEYDEMAGLFISSRNMGIESDTMNYI